MQWLRIHTAANLDGELAMLVPRQCQVGSLAHLKETEFIGRIVRTKDQGPYVTNVDIAAGDRESCTLSIQRAGLLHADQNRQSSGVRWSSASSCNA
jgi:hypothetical protein